MPYPYYPQNPYQSFYPSAYQPQMQQAAFQQPVQQPQQQIQQNLPQQISNVWIYDESEIANYPIAPNNAVRFWIANKPVFFEKSADATGKPTLKVYDYTERAEKPSDASSTKNASSPQYATKDELGVVVNAVQGYSDVLKRIQSDIDSMKGDLYGAVGKRKPMKKSVEAEEDAE
jgi:transglutaminase/protease-like cytokinesis protein 3